MEPRYYNQVPFRGCSLMVKPQSSKLITRVRFPSSPRTNPSDVVGGIFCAQGCRESLPGENTFPRALGIRMLQLVIPSTRTSLWIQRFPGFPGSVWGGFSLFWGGFRGVGAWSPRVVEALLVVADWAFEAASQWVPWPVEGGSVKWCPSRHAPARLEAQPPIGVALVRGSYKSESTRRLEIK